MKPFTDACEKAAGDCDLSISWRSIAGSVNFFSDVSDKVMADVVAQAAAAVRTAALHDLSPSLQLVFLLNETGHARSAESLVHGTFRQRITRRNFIAACDLCRGKAAEGHDHNDDALVIWIDDLTRLEPFRNPYASRAKRFLFRNHPVLLDELRQRRTDKVNRQVTVRSAALRVGRENVFFPAFSEDRDTNTILFCLYWLDFGGAEAFAIQSMETAKAAGFRVVVACDEAGRHRLLAKAAEIADAIYLLGQFGRNLGREAAYLRIVKKHRPFLIHIHHSWTMYRLLPTIRTLGLVSAVIDTTHILEHRFSGFVGEAALYSEFVDRHHVVSEDLQNYYVNKLSVDRDRVKLGRLHDMSRRFHPKPGKWDSVETIDVAFVGRFSQQKRPYLFIEVARRLVRRFGQKRFRFHMVGEGLLRAPTEDLARHHRLSDLITFLPGSAPVQDLLAAAHVLLIPSDNEGLTLVAFEAIRADCLVISCDVGAQREIVDRDLLVPRHPYACVSSMTRLVGRLAEGGLDVVRLLDQQRAQLDANTAAQAGSTVCLDLYKNYHRKAVDVSAA